LFEGVLKGGSALLGWQEVVQFFVEADLCAAGHWRYPMGGNQVGLLWSGWRALSWAGDVL